MTACPECGDEGPHDVVEAWAPTVAECAECLVHFPVDDPGLAEGGVLATAA